MPVRPSPTARVRALSAPRRLPPTRTAGGRVPESDPNHVPDELTADERELLARHVTNTEGPVFALTNLPEVVKGALFARYSRSAKSLRRLLLDEFLDEVRAPSYQTSEGIGLRRAEKLYSRVLNEYGDDSVAQLGSAHIACEGV